MISSDETSTNQNSAYLKLFTTSNGFEFILGRQNKYLLVPIIIGCLWNALSTATGYGSLTYLRSSFLTSLLIGLCTGWAFLYLYAMVISWFSRLAGGSGNVKKTYIVLAWSFLPGLIVIVSYIIAVGVFGEAVIKENTAVGILSHIRTYLLVINAVVGIWSFYILVNGISFIQQIPVVKALFALLAPIIIICSIFYSLTLF